MLLFASAILLISALFGLNAQYEEDEPNYVPPRYNSYKSKFGVPKYIKKDDSSQEHQDLSKVPGEPGVDYPLYHEVPETRFSCQNVPYLPGMYANMETGCQAYHVCHDGREGHQGASFLCSNGTLFNQKEFACDWWYNVDCGQASSYYDLNGDLEKNPFAPKPKSAEETDDYYNNNYNRKPYSLNIQKNY